MSMNTFKISLIISIICFLFIYIIYSYFMYNSYSNHFNHRANIPSPYIVERVLEQQ